MSVLAEAPGTSWIRTRSGRALDLFDPDPADIDLADVAHGLARQPRFAGQTPGVPYSVAQHCVMGCDAIMGETTDMALGALFLLHDAPEAFLGDITTPAQEAMFQVTLGVKTAFNTIHRRLGDAIHLAAGCPLGPPMQLRAVKGMDLRMCRAERDALHGPQDRPWAPEIENAAPIGGLPRIEPWDRELAEGMYLNRLAYFFPGKVTNTLFPVEAAGGWLRHPPADVSALLAGLRSDHLSHELASRGYTVERDEHVEWQPAAVGAAKDLARAEDCFARGDTAEALIWLERALPDRFAGLAARAASFHGGRP